MPWQTALCNGLLFPTYTQCEHYVSPVVTVWEAFYHFHDCHHYSGLPVHESYASTYMWVSHFRPNWYLFLEVTLYSGWLICEYIQYLPFWFQANKQHPEFATTYKNTLQNITVEFSVLEVLLHQEALLSTMEMMMTIQKAIEKSKPPSDAQPPAPQRRSSMVSTVSSTMKKVAPRQGSTSAILKLFVTTVDFVTY